MYKHRYHLTSYYRNATEFLNGAFTKYSVMLFGKFLPWQSYSNLATITKSTYMCMSGLWYKLGICTPKFSINWRLQNAQELCLQPSLIL